MNRSLVLILITSAILFSCSKGLIRFREGLVVDEFNYQYFTAKAKIRFDDGTKDLAGSANVRLQKDSVIWMSLSPGLGVEVARLYISPDSIHFMDRINKTYLRLSFDQLSNEYNFDIDYNLIESLVIGNLIFPYKREDLQDSENRLSYKQDFENFSFENFIGKESKKLEKLSVLDIETETSLSVNYDDFQELGEEIFPFTISATLDFIEGANRQTNITIGFNRAQIENEPLKFPFDVPSKYKAL